MKKIWFLFLLTISLAAMGQPSVKIYAYSQVTTPGNIPAGVTDENGKPVDLKLVPSVNYYIFAVYPGSVQINFNEIWIRGKYYKVQTERVASTPVVNTNNDNPSSPIKTVLVPSTQLQVTAISPVGSFSNIMIRTSWFRNMLKRSALIVSYVYHGKKYFIGVKKIKTLQPVAGI